MSPKTAAKTAALPPKVQRSSTLPRSIADELPVSMQIMQHMREVERLASTVGKSMDKTKKKGAVSTARAFVALHRLMARVNEATKPLNEVFDRYKAMEIPQLFEAEKITHVPLAEGFRVGVSARLFVSIPAAEREKAYDWLRKHGLGDLVTETVNAGTLSAAARTLMEEKNIELPDDLFKSALMPNTSVTVIPTKNG